MQFWALTGLFHGIARQNDQLRESAYGKYYGLQTLYEHCHFWDVPIFGKPHCGFGNLCRKRRTDPHAVHPQHGGTLDTRKTYRVGKKHARVGGRLQVYVYVGRHY